MSHVLIFYGKYMVESTSRKPAPEQIKRELQAQGLSQQHVEAIMDPAQLEVFVLIGEETTPGRRNQPWSTIPPETIPPSHPEPQASENK